MRANLTTQGGNKPQCLFAAFFFSEKIKREGGVGRGGGGEDAHAARALGWEAARLCLRQQRNKTRKIFFPLLKNFSRTS